jgi:hypothetical protein
MFKVNKSSWHYKWLLLYKTLNNDTDFFKLEDSSYERMEHRRNWETPRDFCSYWRAVVVWPALRISLNILAMVPLLFALWFFSLAGITGFGFIALILGTFAGIAVGGTYIFNNLKKKITETVADVTADKDSLIAHAYDSYKEKYCSLVEYEGEVK